MITLLSPSKGQDFSNSSPSTTFTIPFFLDRSEKLIQTIQPYSVHGIRELMDVSENIADLNVQRFQDFRTPFTLQNAKQAIFSFTGDVYSRINATDYSATTLKFSQNHLRILSGLYGLLRPLDLIQPYRLEMKTKLATDEGDNLYQFWGDKILAKIQQTLQTHASPKVINLASNEYFKVIKPKQHLDILTNNIKEIKNNKALTIAIFAKRARGLMANHIMQYGIDDHHTLKDFSEAGYCFSTGDSDTKQFTFTRPQPVK